MQHKPNWILALLVIGILMVPSLLVPVTAFKCVDQATCKNIDQNTCTCGQRTGEFLMDEWAYLWFRGAFETSDIGVKCEGKVHDPAGNLFMSFPLEGWGVYQRPGEIRVLKAGEVVGWIGVNATANAGRFYINSTATSGSVSEELRDMAALPPHQESGEPSSCLMARWLSVGVSGLEWRPLQQLRQP